MECIEVIPLSAESIPESENYIKIKMHIKVDVLAHSRLTDLIKDLDRANSVCVFITKAIKSKRFYTADVVIIGYESYAYEVQFKLAELYDEVLSDSRIVSALKSAKHSLCKAFGG